MSIKLGIMQSRLSPIDTTHKYQYCPRSWSDEFLLARVKGYHAIEWIYDTSAMQPLTHPDGYKDILKYSMAHHVVIDAICADYFVDYPLWDDRWANTNISVLNNIIVNAFKLGAKNVVLPCLDHSAFPTDVQIMNFVRNIQPCLDIAGRYVINLCLETTLGPLSIKNLLTRIDSDRFGICYDTGNSAAEGHNPAMEFHLYGDRIKHVHLKDCPLGGRNVEIGTGDTDFSQVFNLLQKHNYDGPYTLQCARGKEFDLDFIDKQRSKIEDIYGAQIKA